MRVFLMLAAVLIIGQAQAWDETQEARWRNLNEELRCLVCQNQSIAESNAPLAEDLRRQVRQMIESGKSDTEIRSYMTARYGDFVLYRPPFKPTTYLLWLGPLLMLIMAIALVWRLSRRMPQTSSNQVKQSVHMDLAKRLKELADD